MSGVRPMETVDGRLLVVPAEQHASKYHRRLRYRIQHNDDDDDENDRIHRSHAARFRHARKMRSMQLQVPLSHSRTPRRMSVCRRRTYDMHGVWSSLRFTSSACGRLSLGHVRRGFQSLHVPSRYSRLAPSCLQEILGDDAGRKLYRIERSLQMLLSSVSPE